VKRKPAKQRAKKPRSSGSARASGASPSKGRAERDHGTPSRRISRADWICVGVLLGVTLVIFYQGLFDRVGMIREDAAYQYQCFYQFAADEVRDGRFPHWNPFAVCGLPFHASLMGAVLYPLRWPLFFLSWPVGYALSLWAHYFLTGLFMFVFIRATLRCGPVPSLIGAVSFAFGGFTMGHLTHPNYFQAYPWFVLTVLLVTQAVQRSSWVWAVGASLPVGLLALIGAVHLILILGFGLVLWAVAEAAVGLVARARGGEATLKQALWPAVCVAVALLVGGAIGMAQLDPSLLQTKLSVRSDVDWAFITELCAHPIRSAVLFIAPFYWGNSRLGFWGADSFHETCFYMGIVPLILAGVAVVLCPRDRWVKRFVGLCVISAALAMAKVLPFYWVLYKVVPMFDRLRNPVRLLWWVEFGLACLAAIGLQRLALVEKARLRRQATIAAVVAGLVVVVVNVGCLIRLSSLADDPSPMVRQIQQLDGVSRQDAARRAVFVQRVPKQIMQQMDTVTWLGIAAALASSVACVGLIGLRKAPSTLGGSVLVGLLVLDLGMFSGGMFHHSLRDRAVLDVPPQAKYLQDHLGLQRYLSLRGRNAETTLHRGLLFRIRHAIAGGVGINHTPRQEKLIGLLWRRCPRLLNLGGIRYIVADGPIKAGPIRPVRQGDGWCISENTQAFARAFLTRQVRTFDDPNALLAEILMGKTDLSDVALFEQPVDPLPPVGPTDRARGEVADVRSEPGWFEMRTRAPGPRQLVLTETYHPQWRCTIDGAPTPVYLTDWTFMSVRVPAGEYQIRWWFEPTRFKRGLAITVTALVLVVGTLGANWIVTRRAGEEVAEH